MIEQLVLNLLMFVLMFQMKSMGYEKELQNRNRECSKQTNI